MNVRNIVSVKKLRNVDQYRTNRENATINLLKIVIYLLYEDLFTIVSNSTHLFLSKPISTVAKNVHFCYADYEQYLLSNINLVNQLILTTK